MPSRALRACTHPGCPEVLASGQDCPRHPRAKPWANKREYDQQRLRGRRGQERRQRWLRDHPLCGDRLDGPSGEHSACVRERRGSAAVTLDHIIPLSRGGAEDEGNLQSLCRRCAGLKDAADRRP